MSAREAVGVRDSIYAGFFSESPKVFDYDGNGDDVATPLSTGMPLRTGQLGNRTPFSRMGTTAQLAKARPSTAVRGVGYTSDASRTFEHQAQHKKSVVVDAKKHQSPEEKYRGLEKKIQDLLEQSILLSTGPKADLRGALNKAKEASSLDRKLLQMRDQSNGNYVHNFDLTFSVLFNLANIYALNDMHVEALNTYNLVTKNKMFSNANRLKINMGNIYVKLGMFPKAIKMYRMALDQVPINQKELRLRVTHNIGILFVRMGQYSDAATSFEFIMSEKGDVRAGMHLVLCYYALGDVDKMKRAFQLLLDVSTEFDEDEKLNATSPNATQEYIFETIRSDELQLWEQKQQQFTRKAILMTANLIAPAIEDSFDDGYNWCVEAIKNSKHQSLASELDLNRAIMFLKQDDPTQAIDSLQYFEKRETNVAINASINLTFIYLLMNNLQMASNYAESMRRLDSYNPATLINNGVYEMIRGDYETAKSMFEAAVEIDATSFEALYNLGLVNKRLNDFDAALGYFRKLSSISVHEVHPQVLYQMGNLYELVNDTGAALELYLQMLGSQFLDDEILRKIGLIYEQEADQQLAFHYHLESYRVNPVNMNTINWIGTHYIRLQVAERAIPYYERAIMNNPNNTFYMIRTAGCCMKIGHHKKALRFFQDIYRRFPDNADCLRALIRITHNSHPQLHEKYKLELQRLTKTKDTRKRIGSSVSSLNMTIGRRTTSAITQDGDNSASSVNFGDFAEEHVGRVSDGPSEYYTDPLGPMAARPRTGMRPKTGTFDNEDTDDDINPDEMLPQ
ncbi:intraflagellar transport protein 88 homolog [Lutzomyia longipalpis]|uniref:intraflagellar transport protein 88 homolog n=1 Tax=Lutzomyia longipalpis TaxID=7200 RepID=UPI0024839D3D|nr:intraflagellar transport protein 88 homolog [Lutzomyia longipalpis]